MNDKLLHSFCMKPGLFHFSEIAEGKCAQHFDLFSFKLSCHVRRERWYDENK